MLGSPGEEFAPVSKSLIECPEQVLFPLDDVRLQCTLSPAGGFPCVWKHL